ncbi:MAG: class I SAM-dependent methyltransferase, partial [Acidimicrobiales bacterium]
RLGTYFEQVSRLLTPGGRVVNHAISRTGPAHRKRLARTGFIQRYVFPDGELHEVGSVISAVQDSGLEVCHMALADPVATPLRGTTDSINTTWRRRN